MKTLSDKIFRYVKIFTLLILTLMTSAAFLQVVFRYVFKYPLPWTEELARFLFVWLTFIGSAAAVKSKSHIAMDLFVSMFPKVIQKYITLLALIVFLGFSILLVKQGLFLTQMNMGQESDALGIKMGYPYLAIPVGGILMAFFIIEQIITVLRKGVN
ncbi:MAG: TRAP-type transport system small permease protein [Clostridia bacterium]|nr:TRAP-type transport system small permease protein [Clostridia bacterium]MDN5322962.1 TRAP-type transport system small permease protein [Clostridia bacterium]